ncbi:C39 family peptidase [uncultured Phenylobacterium sp.]|uniref:C39 family peptidase n=1 Tax=uncultured Phenylobacterium sp. TaxID=349273 RepID=UPI0025E566BD|nr:C39 family peptidase [uncultured Phenylobacterium sp.]
MTRARALLVSATMAMTMTLGAAGARSAEVPVRTPVGQFGIPVRSMIDQRFTGVVRQRYDFSCGSAALATLLTYHYEMPTDEVAAFQAMFAAGDQNEIRRRGFSLLEMQQYLAKNGLTSNAYRESLDRLQKVGVPAIVLIEPNGYRHFVVIKGLTDREVLVADPAVGLKRYDRPAFEAIWRNRLLFVIEGKAAIGRSRFNETSSWTALPRARFDNLATREALMTATWLGRGPGEF